MVFVALEMFIVNSKITLVEYQINKLFAGENDDKSTEDASIEKLITLSNEHNELMKQVYHLNHIEVEINLIEMVMEQEPQVVLQGAFFILMQALVISGGSKHHNERKNFSLGFLNLRLKSR